MYAKLFASLFDGSMRGQPELILVFINMLVRCDASGCVERTPRAIADETGLPLDRVGTAIAALEAPDPESRTPDLEGRRIVLLSPERSWGWRITNHHKYRGIRDEEQRRRQNREAQRRYKISHGKPESAELSQPKPKSAHTEAEAEAEAEAKREIHVPAQNSPSPKKRGGKAKYGELAKVRLTADEHAKLAKAYGDKLPAAIDILDAYIASNGKRYASHYAVMKRDGWVWDRTQGQARRPAEGKAPRPVWKLCAAKCKNWDKEAGWCKKFIKAEPKTPDHCNHF